jgi:hypothetical protein
MDRPMVNSRKLGLAGAALTVALVSSGCASATPGAAAIVGDTRITERQLTSQVEQVLKAQGRPVDSASEALVVTTLDRMITALLVEQIAEEQGITITQGELDATIANYAEASGGRQAFEDALLAQDLAPDDIEELFRVNILAQKMGMILDPGGTPDSQSASIFAAVAAYSEEVGTEVSPRYGSWDPAGLVVGPPPNDLSAPIQIS